MICGVYSINYEFCLIPSIINNMRITSGYMVIGAVCFSLLAVRFYNYILMADLPVLNQSYNFELCPVTIGFPDSPYLEESFGLEKITARAGGYLYRAACIPLDNENAGSVSLLPADLLNMFNADEVHEIIDTNFEISGIVGGPLFYYEFLGQHKKEAIKSLGAVFFRGAYILNVELITFDPEQDNIDAQYYFDSVINHVDQFENRPPRPSRNDPLI